MNDPSFIRTAALQAAQQSYQEALSYGGGSSADAALIKAAIERLGLSEDEEEEEM